MRRRFAYFFLQFIKSCVDGEKDLLKLTWPIRTSLESLLPRGVHPSAHLAASSFQGSLYLQG